MSLGTLARIACLALAAFAGPASAVIYTGIWDPAFGAPFTNLGWRGNATFFVPDTCVPTGTVDVSNTGSCGGAAAVTFAEVQFYDITDANLTTVATLDIDETSLTISTLRYVADELTQLDTNLSALVSPSASLSAFGVSATTQWGLQFTLGGGPRLFWSDCARTGNFCDSGFNNNDDFPARFVITRVPEPASMALVGLGLFGLAGVRRRRSRD